MRARLAVAALVAATVTFVAAGCAPSAPTGGGVANPATRP